MRVSPALQQHIAGVAGECSKRRSKRLRNAVVKGTERVLSLCSTSMLQVSALREPQESLKRALIEP
jgi:hypothetical protein